MKASDYTTPQTPEEREWVDAPSVGRELPVNQGDIYLVSLDPTEGREQQGRRPVVVVSATAFQ